MPFQEQAEVRREAVFNLVKRGIDRLIVIGGDGSLKGWKWRFIN
jgi:6-phosphofructokinase